MKKPNFEEVPEHIDKLLEVLLGQPDETEPEEAEDLLTTVGIDPDELYSSLYTRLQKEAERFRAARKPLPHLLKKALDDLRPPSTPNRNHQDLETQAKEPSIYETMAERAIHQSVEVPMSWVVLG